MVWWAGALAQNMLRPLPNGQAQTGEQSPRLGGEFMWLLGTTVLVLGHAGNPPFMFYISTSFGSKPTFP